MPVMCVLAKGPLSFQVAWPEGGTEHPQQPLLGIS